MIQKLLPQQTTTDIQATTVDSIEEFAKLEPAWHQFEVDPMNGFDWNFSWWQAFESIGQLNVVKFERDGQVIGIVPLYSDRWFGLQRLRFVGSGKTCSDYLDIVCDPDDLEQLDQCLAEYLLANQFDLLEIECPRNNRLSNGLRPLLQSHYRSEVRSIEPSWRIELPGSWDAMMSSRKSSLRRKLRKAEKRLSSGEFILSSTMDGDCVETSFGVFCDLHQERFQSKGEPGVFSDSKFEQFLKEALIRLCNQKQAEIVLLHHESGEAVGAQVLLRASSGYQYYQSGYRGNYMKSEPGYLMFTAAIKNAIARGDQYFDFLRGDEPYKGLWGAVPMELNKARFFTKRPLVTMIAGGVNTSRQLVRNLKSRLRR